MTFDEFFERNSRFNGLSNNEQILYAAWFLQEVNKLDKFGAPAINALFRDLHLTPPPTSTYLPRMAEMKPPKVLYRRNGYYLEGRTRRELTEKLGDHPSVVIVSNILAQATLRVTDEVERIYLEETIKCYKAGAFRASIVMMWNLCFDHIKRWIFSDVDRVKTFNIGLSKRFPKLNFIASDKESLEDLRESQVIEGLRSARLITKNIEQILKEKLNRRNAAAHPSTIEISQAQADDLIIDLINNVISKLPPGDGTSAVGETLED